MVALNRSRTVVFTGEKVTVSGGAIIDHLKSLKFLNNVRCMQAVQKGFAVSFNNEDIPKSLLEMREMQLEGRDVFVTRPDTTRSIVKIYDLPYELEDKHVREMLENYGEVLSFRRDRMAQLPLVENGIRTAMMIMEDEVPSRHAFGKYVAKIWYPSVKKVCRICQEEGHIGANCPEFKCRRCKKQGHYVRNCPDPVICRNCNEEGHFARDCMAGTRCSKCRDLGHYAETCTRAQVASQPNVIELETDSQVPGIATEPQTAETQMDLQNFVAEMTSSTLFTPDMLNRAAPNSIPLYSDGATQDDFTDDDYEDDNSTTQDQSSTSGQPPTKRNRRRPRGKKK